ncbi:hypothetical protein [Myxosarcina sp. GI1]|uniref:hypothetical protein n=1 Tax=Myxosarcina sp. GI1 TaxID=1541065 RepID=UPI00055AE39A|nr:hypothetical protein [Myxosarcina sp. GI1]
MKFRVEELFLDSKSGAFQLAVRSCWGFTRGRSKALHWKPGISYLKIDLRWLRVLHKGRDLLQPVALINTDPQPCFTFLKAKRQYTSPVR